MKEKTTISSGIGFCDILCVAFIALKICGVINWSWVWVLSPLWIQLIGIIIVVSLFCAVKRG